MAYSAQVKAKKSTAEQAISLIRSDDAVLVSGEPGALLDALYQGRERFQGLRLYSVFGFSSKAGANLYSREMAGHAQIVSTAQRGSEEKQQIFDNAEQVLVNLSEAEAYLENTCRPSVLLAHCPPLSEDGYFYLGIDEGCASAALTRGAKVIVQVNENLPLIHSHTCRIPLHGVYAICEHHEALPPSISAGSTSAEDEAIASFVAELIPHGATVQLGPGAIPGMVGRFLAQHKDLGIHTDCFHESQIDLIKNGAVNNSRKEILRGISVGAYFDAAPDSLAYLHKNPKVMMERLSWVCRPEVASQISGFVSVNAGLAVDFRAQVCTGNLGLGFMGGVGSHLDFARGAKRAKDGKSFIVMRSTRLGEDGARISNISPALPNGSLVSVPRSDVMYLATEYGVVNLRDIGIKERVNALISIAHPDFREWLTEEAEKTGYIKRP